MRHAKADLIKRIANRAMFAQEPEIPDVRDVEQAVLSSGVITLLRRTFTPKGLRFFQFYMELKSISMGKPVTVDLNVLFRQVVVALNQVTSPVDKKPLSPIATNKIADLAIKIRPLLSRVMSQEKVKDDVDDNVWRQINLLYVPVILDVARDKEIFLKATLQGTERWGRFVKMTPSQEYLDRLKDSDPESYALMVKNKETKAVIEERLRQTIEDSGRIVQERMVMGRPAIMGIDPVSKEALVYDLDGEVLPLDDYKRKRVAYFDFIKQTYREPTKTQVPLKQLRRLSDAEFEALEKQTRPSTVTLPNGKVINVPSVRTAEEGWSALTDNKAKVGRLTRIFPTIEYPTFYTNPDGEVEVFNVKVISGGRYKGIFLDDMVNSQGRLIEGTSYSFDPMTGRSRKVFQKIDQTQAEPYVTTAEVRKIKQFQKKPIEVVEKKLFIKIPSGSAHKPARDALKKLACEIWEPGKPGKKKPGTGGKKGCIPGFVYQPVPGDPQSATFYFNPKDFGVVMDTLNGMSLSTEALSVVQDYYKELSIAETAASGDLAPYEAAALSSPDNGFVVSKKDYGTGSMRPFRLSTLQKKALAWMDTNGGQGVCGLDTGVGKTLTSIAMMQKLYRDGLAEGGASYVKPDGTEVKTNGRFLVVVPKALVGAHVKEIRDFMTDPNVLIDRLDVITYPQFSGAAKSGKVPKSLSNVEFWKGKEWDPSLYVSIFFDEAQALKRPDTDVSKAAINLWHPRKICLTASPMEKEPMEAYVLAAICKNAPLKGRSPEARANQAEMRKFKERFCETARGRIIGAVQDPLAKRELVTWVKRNIFYADKRDDMDNPLKPLDAKVQPVVMTPEVEALYRGVTKSISKSMESAVALFRDKKINKDTKDENVERLTLGIKSKIGPLVGLMNGLSNYPAETMLDIAKMMEKGVFVSSVTGEEFPLPDILTSAMAAWKKAFTPEKLRELAATVGNPKLDSARQFIASRLDATNGSSRVLLFSDDVKMCRIAVQHMAKTVGGDMHLLALEKQIRVFGAGGAEMKSLPLPVPGNVLEQYNEVTLKKFMEETKGVNSFSLPFVEKPYKRFAGLPAKDRINSQYRKTEWRSFVMSEIVNPNRAFRTAVLQGKAYSHGLNLQAFDTVIHLDRNNWNAESMKQRTARAWRQGQKEPVTELTLDAVYSPSNGGKQRSEFDKTLDEIRMFLQELEGAVFDQIIKDSHDPLKSPDKLGQEWLDTSQQDAANLRLDRKTFELVMSPVVGRQG